MSTGPAATSRTTGDRDPLVSVVVIGRNEGERLRRCLKSVFAMEKDGFSTEVLYVDSGSSDASVALATEMGTQAIALHAKRPTAALGRNAGWRQASGSIILFLDGDTVLHPRFVADSLSDFKNPEVAVIWGHRRELHPEHSIYNRVLDLDWIYKAGVTLYCGSDALFRRDVLTAVGGFDEKLIAGKEPERCGRIRSLGFTVLHVDRSMTGHDLAITWWAQYWKRSIRAGYAFAEISTRSLATGSRFWVAEARGNFRRAIVLMVLAALAIILSLLLSSLAPSLLLAIFLVLLRYVLRGKRGGNTAIRWHCCSRAFTRIYSSFQYSWASFSIAGTGEKAYAPPCWNTRNPNHRPSSKDGTSRQVFAGRNAHSCPQERDAR